MTYPDIVFDDMELFEAPAARPVCADKSFSSMLMPPSPEAKEQLGAGVVFAAILVGVLACGLLMCQAAEFLSEREQARLNEAVIRTNARSMLTRSGLDCADAMEVFEAGRRVSARSLTCTRTHGPRPAAEVEKDL